MNNYRKTIGAIKLLPNILEFKYNTVTCINQTNFNELSKIRDLLVEKEVRVDFFFCLTEFNFASIQADGSISAYPNLREEKTGELLFCHLKRIEEGEQNILIYSHFYIKVLLLKENEKSI